jgi:hypothetical protein
MFYKDALKLAVELEIKKLKIVVIKYMICSCLIESNELNDLLQIVEILQGIEVTIKEKFPAIYCLLAEAHCKLYR